MASAGLIALVNIALAAGVAAILAAATGLPVATLLLAAAPGGVAEMCITAKVLQLGVPLVTVCHVLRVAVLTLGAPLGYRLFVHLTAEAGD